MQKHISELCRKGESYSEFGSGNAEFGSGNAEFGNGNAEVGSGNGEVESGNLEVGSGKTEVGKRNIEAGCIAHSVVVRMWDARVSRCGRRLWYQLIAQGTTLKAES